MTNQEIEKLIEDLTTSYASGEDGKNGWLIVGAANKEKAELIVRKHHQSSKMKNDFLKLKYELSVYKQIILKSNFAPIMIKERDLE